MLEQPVASYCAKIILKKNYPKICFENKNVTKSDPKEEAIGIDWKYIDEENKIKIFIQVKTSDSNAGKNLRTRMSNATNIQKNVYLCILDSSKKDQYTLDMSLNDEKIV